MLQFVLILKTAKLTKEVAFSEVPIYIIADVYGNK